MELKMRNLKTTDVFKMSRILSKIDVDFKSIDTKGMNETQAGMAMVKLVLENIWKAEKEINDFLGDLVGISGEEFAELDLDVVGDVIAQFKNQKGLARFFELANK